MENEDICFANVLNEARSIKNIDVALLEVCTDNARKMIVANAEAQFSPHITCFTYTQPCLAEGFGFGPCFQAVAIKIAMS